MTAEDWDLYKSVFGQLLWFSGVVFCLCRSTITDIMDWNNICKNMSSTEISPLADYNSTSINTRCGEIYCSENLDSFLIHCGTCPQQFYLLSCTLFIKHLKECKTMGFQKHEQQNITTTSQDSYSYNNLFKDDSNHSNTNNSEEPEGDQIDPLIPFVKIEIVKEPTEPHDLNERFCDEEYLSNYMDEDELPIEKVIGRNKIDGIIEEYRKHPILWDPGMAKMSTTSEKEQHLRQITKKVNTKFNMNLTYKELYQKVLDLRQMYRQVLKKKHIFESSSTQSISKFNPKLWYFEQLSFIQGLNDDIEVELPSLEETDAKIIAKQEISIEDDDAEIPNDHGNSANEYQDGESEDDNGNVERSETEIVSVLIQEYKKHPCLYRYDYNGTNCRYSRADAITAIRKAINKRFNTRYTNVEVRTKICRLRSSYRRILRTKEKFEKLPTNANTKFLTNWRYFNKLSFIGTEESDFLENRIISKKDKSAQRRKQKKLDKKNEDDVDEEENEEEVANINDDGNDEQMHHHDTIILDSDDKQSNENYQKIDLLPEDEDQPIEFEHLSYKVKQERHNMKSRVKNKELIIAIINEYRKCPGLWDVKSYTNDSTYRRQAFENMAKIINRQFDTEYNYKEMSEEIVKLRASYKRMSRRIKNEPKYRPKLWYAERLSFIEGKEKPIEGKVKTIKEKKTIIEEKETFVETSTKDNGEEEDTAMWNESNEASLSAYESDEDNTEDMFRNRKIKIKSKNMIYEIIELYKSTSLLWDTKHPFHTIRKEQRKAIQQSIDKLGREHGCYITIKEYRYQIRYIRDSYFKALRLLNAAKKGDKRSSSSSSFSSIYKPFFFDRVSFLEPFADKSSSIYKLNPAVGEPNEDFTYLVENKSLMIDFIEIYKAHPCLWDSTDIDKDDEAAHSEAYDKIMNTFAKYDVILTKEQVLAAISFLQFSFVKQKKINDKKLATNTTSSQPPLPPIWFYDNLLFLDRFPKTAIVDKYCSHCDQHFQTLAAYEKHKIEIGDYPYKCPVCDAGFISRSKFAYHQITHKEPHKCEQCDFQAHDKHNFNVHMRRHKGIQPFKCPECDKGFVTSSDMHRHVRMHTGERPFVCDVCGKALTSHSEFRQHMRRHTNQRDHKCKLCGRAFLSASMLRDHMTTHSNERKHVCETCGAAFKRKKTLLQHEGLHAETKKHECKICGKMFAQKAGVYSHMKSHGIVNGSSA